MTKIFKRYFKSKTTTEDDDSDTDHQKDENKIPEVDPKADLTKAGFKNINTLETEDSDELELFLI
jgi:hypothetical protein